MTTQEADKEIKIWLGIIAGDGLTVDDLLRAAVALRDAVRAKRDAERGDDNTIRRSITG